MLWSLHAATREACALPTKSPHATTKTQSNQNNKQTNKQTGRFLSLAELLFWGFPFTIILGFPSDSLLLDFCVLDTMPSFLPVTLSNMGEERRKRLPLVKCVYFSLNLPIFNVGIPLLASTEPDFLSPKSLRGAAEDGGCGH